jgi:hypothetical protein
VSKVVFICVNVGDFAFSWIGKVGFPDFGLRVSAVPPSTAHKFSGIYAQAGQRTEERLPLDTWRGDLWCHPNRQRGKLRSAENAIVDVPERRFASLAPESRQLRDSDAIRSP